VRLQPVWLLARATTLDTRALKQLAVLLLCHPLATLLDDRTHDVVPLDVPGRFAPVRASCAGVVHQTSTACYLPLTLGRDFLGVNPRCNSGADPIPLYVAERKAEAMLEPTIHNLFETLPHLADVMQLPLAAVEGVALVLVAAVVVWLTALARTLTR
jgi:hypothetical protein